MQASIVGENAIDMPVGSYHRCLAINSPCDSPSTSTLSRSSNVKNQKSPPPLIRDNDSIGGAECYGFELVDQQSGDHKWETNSLRCSRDDDRIRWSFQESQLHINVKELLAAFLTLQTFVGNRKEINVLLKIDNMTTVNYINRMGGTHSKQLMQITSQMWNWSLDRIIVLSAEHLPGVQNVDADRESRRKWDSSEWKLDPMIFQLIMQILGPCQVDLYASRISAQLPIYMS